MMDIPACDLGVYFRKPWAQKQFMDCLIVSLLHVPLAGGVAE
jgi:hypothetical protein